MKAEEDFVRARNARITDPETSHEAGIEAEESGRASLQREICLEVVERCPGLTAAEIAKEAGLERHVPSRRLPEMRKRKQVVNGEVRKCNVTGRSSLTWFTPFDRGLEPFVPVQPAPGYDIDEAPGSFDIWGIR